MLEFAWVISIIASFLGGYHFRVFTKKVEHVEKEIKQKLDKPQEEPASVLIDPLDPLQEAKLEQDNIQKRINAQ